MTFASLVRVSDTSLHHGAEVTHMSGHGDGDHVYLYQGSHLSPLLPISCSIVEYDVRGPDPLPGQPCVGDVVVLSRVPHQEHIVPLGDDFAVCS